MFALRCRTSPIRLLSDRHGLTTRKLSTGTPPLKLLFLGGDAFSVGVLEPILEAREEGVWSDLLVVTSGEKQVGRGSKGTRRVVPALHSYAMERGLDLDNIPQEGFKSWQIPSKYNPPVAAGAPATPSTILITASFGHIIPTPFLTSYFPEASSRLNVHPSLLPQYRGAAPIQWSIADSWRERHGVTGVTVQSLALGKGKVDCGEIWAQEGDIAIDDKSTYQTMLPILARKGGELLLSTLRRIQSNTARSEAQPDQGEFRKASKIRPSTAQIDFSVHSALELEARHRAFGFQEPIWTTMNGTAVQFLDVRLSTDPDAQNLEVGQARFDRANNRLLVRCVPVANGMVSGNEDVTVLEVRKVHQAGKRAMEVKDWWNGLRGIGKSKVVMLGT